MSAEIVPIPRLSDEAVRERMFLLLQRERPDGDFKVAEIVGKVLGYLREHDPDLMDRFAELMIAETLNRFYRKRFRDARRRLNRSILESRFRDAIDGVEVAQDWFKQVYTIDGKQTMRAVGEMTGADHRYLAERYQKSGQRDLLLAAFHRRVADVVGKKRTQDVISEVEYERMFRVVVKQEDQWEL